MPEDCVPSYTQEQSHTCCMPEDCIPSYTQTTVPHMLYAWRLCTLLHSNNSPTHALCLKTVYPLTLKQQSHTCCMPEDCVPSYTQTTVPHMLYAWRLCTLLHSNNSPTHALCLKTVYPLTLKQQSHTCCMPEDCVPSYTQTTVPHMLYAWRLCTLWNSNDSPTHALCLKTLPSEAQTAVPYICSVPQDCTFTPCNSNNSPTHALCLKTLPSEAQTLKHAVPYNICSVSPDCMFTPWNSNSPTHALCLKACVPSETQTHALLWLVNLSLTHAL